MASQRCGGFGGGGACVQVYGGTSMDNTVVSLQHVTVEDNFLLGTGAAAFENTGGGGVFFSIIVASVTTNCSVLFESITAAHNTASG
jgi:hypothetical protein